jgi:lipopolysaccharide transport system ATP-binding protein
MSETIIKAENLSKQYRIGAQKGYRTFRETLLDTVKVPFQRFSSLLSAPRSKLSSLDDTIWALKDVSFEVKQGEVVGIIGRNGAGKSTLLKILSKITEPTTGRVELRGRVGSLLEVGTGFHPELTGHENVYLYGAILGMDRWEVTRKFDEIVAFAGVEKFIETPVKRYSSGMYMRLAFAVAAFMETEILLVDEVLAVGDAAFQKKCLGKMGDVSSEGRTVLFVSHNMAAVEHLCNKTILLESGQIAFRGETRQAISAYLSSHKAEIEKNLSMRKDRQGTGRVRVTSVCLKNQHGEKTNSIKMGEAFSIEVEYEGSLKNAVAGVIITNGWIEQLMRGYSYESVKEPVHLTSGRFTCFFETNYLMSGEYSISIWLGQYNQCGDYIRDCLDFTIEITDVYNTGVPPNPRDGIVFTKHRWRFFQD